MANETSCNSGMSLDFLNEMFRQRLDTKIDYWSRNKINFSKIDYSQITPELVEQWAQSKTSQEIGKVVGYFQGEWNEEERVAHNFYREPCESSFSKAVMETLTNILDIRMSEEVLAHATDDLVFVPVVDNDRYSFYSEEYAVSYRRILYLKDADSGNYVLTDFSDDTYWGNEDSFIEEQLEYNDVFISTAKGIYQKGKDGKYRLLPLDYEEYSFRVISREKFWRIPKDKTQRTVLVSQNPVTGEYDEYSLPVERFYGDNFLTTYFKNESGEWRRGFYVRDIKTGKFVPDGDIPFVDACDDCISASVHGDEFNASYYIRGKEYSYLGKVGEKGQIKFSE